MKHYLYLVHLIDYSAQYTNFHRFSINSLIDNRGIIIQKSEKLLQGADNCRINHLG